MASGNNVTIVGNLTREVELKYLDGGSAVANFGVAVNRRWQDGKGEWVEEVNFFDVTAWKDLAENVAQSLEKGDRVIVDGRLQFRSWETKDGEKRSKVEIVADEVGPSLRWAEASVTKNEKKDNGGRSDGGRSGGGRSGGGRSGGRSSEPQRDYSDEPF